MNASAPPAPRVIPIRRVLETAGAGNHSSVEYREVQRFLVAAGDEELAEYDTKAPAEAFALGWEAHRARMLARIQESF